MRRYFTNKIVDVVSKNNPNDKYQTHLLSMTPLDYDENGDVIVYVYMFSGFEQKTSKEVTCQEGNRLGEY